MYNLWPNFTKFISFAEFNVQIYHLNMIFFCYTNSIHFNGYTEKNSKYRKRMIVLIIYLPHTCLEMSYSTTITDNDIEIRISKEK